MKASGAEGLDHEWAEEGAVEVVRLGRHFC